MDLIIDDYCAWVGGWREVEASNTKITCLFVTYEDIRKDSTKVFSEILQFFGIHLDEEVFQSTITAASKVRGKKRSGWYISGYPGMSSTKRKGKVGGWRKELTADQVAEFRERMGGGID